MSNQLGLPVVPQEPGDHVCVFYRGPAERARLMSAYLDDGLRAGQACLCVAGSAESATARSTLTVADLATEDADAARHQNLPTDVVAPDAVLGEVEAWCRAALEQEGRSPARVVAGSWTMASRSQPSVDHLTCYETGVAAWATARRQSFVCLYDLDRFAGVVYAVIKAHTGVWVQGVMLQNPYCRSGR